MHNIQPLLNKHYVKAVTAKGIYIQGEDGKQYLDGSSGAITSSLGHSHPKIIEGMKRQADKLQFVYRSQFGSDEAEKLATKLFEISVQRSHPFTFFVNGGTEAIETSMKIALQHWQEQGMPGKKIFVSRKKSYHGITMGALSISGHPLRRKRFENSLTKYPWLQSDLEKESVEDQARELEQVIEENGAENIAALVAEPITGAAGAALIPKPGYYQALKKVCEENNILFIADEGMTGLGRTGKWFALEHWSTVADIVTVGKSLAAGYAPIAATLMTEKVIAPIKAGSGLIMSGHTYSGHPLSCGTALRVIEVVEEDRLIDNVNEMGNYLKGKLDSIKEKFDFIQTVRGRGLLLGAELNPERKGLQARLIDCCFENGLLIYPSVGGPDGKDENGVLISPPFIISKSQCDELLEKFEQSLRQVSS
ncbi:MAG: aminotransferase class III-fold pyridoxal phosphate-dependent enzyme [Cyclobacteriaceae bacterium]